jgi:3-oxoacyl-[acyl-carrier protein] reductase
VLSIDLAGSRALVTGAGQGVGRQTAITLAEAGATVLVNDRIAERCEQVAAQITALGLAAEPRAFDVARYGAIEAAISAAGGVDVLVNNAGNAGAGTLQLKTVAEELPAELETFSKVNLDGVMLCTRAVLPGMIERRGGRIITIISDAARLGEPRLAANAAAEAGAAGFLRSVASEVGRYGITTNCISIGTMPRP